MGITRHRYYVATRVVMLVTKYKLVICFILLIRGLFNCAFDSYDYIASNDTIINEQRIGKYIEGSDVV